MSLIAAIKGLFGISSNGDRQLICEDCQKKFIFDKGEQKFFKEKGFTDPKRCPRCRKKVKSRLQKRSRSSRHHHHRGRRRHTILDGNSPYADE